MTEQTQISPDHLPTTLNGYPVKAVTISDNRDTALVLVHRGDRFQPWVVAHWWPELADRWEWGHYFDSAAEADHFRAGWIRHHAKRSA